jgi:chromosome partitioning protein
MSRLLRALGVSRRGKAKRARRASKRPAQVTPAGKPAPNEEAGGSERDESHEREVTMVEREDQSVDQDNKHSGASISPSRTEDETTLPATERATSSRESVTGQAEHEQTPDGSPDKDTATAEDDKIVPQPDHAPSDQEDEDRPGSPRPGGDAADGIVGEAGSMPDRMEPTSAVAKSRDDVSRAKAQRSRQGANEGTGERGTGELGTGERGTDVRTGVSPVAPSSAAVASPLTAGAPGHHDSSEDHQPGNREELIQGDPSEVGAHWEQDNRASGELADSRGQESRVAPRLTSPPRSDGASFDDRGPRDGGLPPSADGPQTSRSDPAPDIPADHGPKPRAPVDPTVAIGRNPDPLESQVSASTPAPTGPTVTAETISTPPPVPRTAAHDQSPASASMIPADIRSTATPIGEASPESGVEDGETGVATHQGSKPGDVSAADKSAQGEQHQWLSLTTTNGPGLKLTAAETAALSGAPLDEAGSGVVESSQRAMPVEHVDGGVEAGCTSSQEPTLADGARNDDHVSDGSPSGTASTTSGASDDGVATDEASVIKRLQLSPLSDGSERTAAFHDLSTADQAQDLVDNESNERAIPQYVLPPGLEEAPPGLEPGLEEVVKRLGASDASPSGNPSRRTMSSGDAPTVSSAHGNAAGTNAAHPAGGTSAARPQEENISPARTASELGRAAMSPRMSSRRQRRPIVSRETVGLGGTADRAGEDEVMEDEAAIAVREAALRAAAQVSGTSEAGQQDGAAMDSPDHVSRETSASQTNVRGGEAPPGTTVEGSPRVGPEASQGIDREQAARDARVTFRIARGGHSPFVVAVANQKGGVGKSTTAVNLGAYLALAGAHVLVADLDPQGNASTGLGLDHRRLEPSVYDVLTGDADAASAIRQTAVGNLDVLPSTIDLAGAEVELVNALSRETRLRQALSAVRYGYDIVFIDCPPSLGLLTVNALAAADELLIPIQCEYYALEGLGQLLRNVDLVRVNLNPGLHIGGIVLTMYDGRTRLAEQVVQEVRKHFSELVYHTVVPRSVRLSEAPGYGVPIALYDPLSRGGIAYRDLAFELADRTGLLAPTQEGAS